jgi:hypothetical protein
MSSDGNALSKEFLRFTGMSPITREIQRAHPNLFCTPMPEGTFSILLLIGSLDRENDE